MNLAVDQLQPLENCIRHRIIPSLTGRGPSGDLERKLLALPPRLGGMGISNPVETMSINYNFSVEVTAPLVEKIISQDEGVQVILPKLECRRRRVHQMRRTLQCAEASQLKEQLPADIQRSMELASEKGASNWLSTLPLEKYDFALHKGAFRDAVCLRYGWIPQKFFYSLCLWTEFHY